jgi:hypothetical protein
MRFGGALWWRPTHNEGFVLHRVCDEWRIMVRGLAEAGPYVAWAAASLERATWAVTLRRLSALLFHLRSVYRLRSSCGTPRYVS